MTHSHRKTLSQTHKPFKSRHASKGAQKNAAKGRVEKASKTGHATPAQTKAARRNHAKQVQANKRAKAIEQIRHNVGEREGRAARIISVIALCDDIDTHKLIADIIDTLELEAVQSSISQLKQVNLANPKATLQFLTPAYNDTFACMDAAASSDFTVLAVSGQVEVAKWGDTLLRSLASYGVGQDSVRAVVTDLPDNGVAASGTRKSLLSFLSHFFPSLDRVFSPSIPSEANNLIRSLALKIPKPVSWKSARARLLAEETSYDAETSCLSVTGVVRGRALDLNRLVYLQGVGDFQLAKVTIIPDKQKQKAKAGAMDTDMADSTVFEPTPSEADSLRSTNVPDEGDELNAEQTWPTEEEMASAPAANGVRVEGEMLPPALPGTTPRNVKRVPKGTSTYQAAWLVDDEDDEDYSDSEDEGEMAVDGEEEQPSAFPEEEEEYEYLDMDASTQAGASTHHELTRQEEEAQYAAYLEERANNRNQITEEEDAEFPDEIDTPLDVPVRTRFARYRGLRSLRTSEWDPYEQLPQEYSRCFMFQNWKAIGKRLVDGLTEDGRIEAGTRVKVEIKDVPQSVYEQAQSSSIPLAVFSLLKHEHKYSVVNFTTQRNTEYEETVKSKDNLILQLGSRRFAINPIFSQHNLGNNGKGVNNVHKFERYLKPGPTTSVGTAYLPITFGVNVPAILFTSDQQPDLIGTGTLLSADPTRIVAKRIILTGHPYKLHKRTATIRYMFFNASDIEYYKPIELRTKKGRKGFIKESLGTHGYFKAGFDGPMDQMDTVCMSLYKRVFPKWGALAADQRGSANKEDTEMA